MKSFKKANLLVKTLTDYNILIEEALKKGYITEKDVESLQAWRKDPASWGLLTK